MTVSRFPFTQQNGNECNFERASANVEALFISYQVIKFMYMEKDKVQRIIEKNHRFISPYEEPESYYLWTDDHFTDEQITDEIIHLYFNKLQYAAANADRLINQAFKPEFYQFYGVDKQQVSSPDEMCSGLIFDSFVLSPGQKLICANLSNDQYLFGHFIAVEWDYHWQIKSVWID